MRNHKTYLAAILPLVIFCISIIGASCSKSSNKNTINVQKGPIDTKLVKHWNQSYVSTIEMSNPNGSGTDRDNSAEMVDFILNADGTYTQEYYNHSTGGCNITILGTKTGGWHVGTEDGGTLYLDEITSHEKATDNCNHSYDFDKDIALKKIKYIYTVSEGSGAKHILTLQTTSGPDDFDEL